MTAKVWFSSQCCIFPNCQSLDVVVQAVVTCMHPILLSQDFENQPLLAVFVLCMASLLMGILRYMAEVVISYIVNTRPLHEHYQKWWDVKQNSHYVTYYCYYYD